MTLRGDDKKKSTVQKSERSTVQAEEQHLKMPKMGTNLRCGRHRIKQEGCSRVH